MKKLLSAVLCAALLLALLPAPARAVTLTAVNDTLLPIDESTMPARMGGELYVPYSVFSSLGVRTYSEDSVLNMSANGEVLSFSLDEGYTYDQNLNSYATPAYAYNGTVYVPVKLCCGKFGLGYSTLSVAGQTVLRVTDGSAQSDSGFVAAKSGEIESAIDAYYGVEPEPAEPEPYEPAPEPVSPEPSVTEPEPEPEPPIPEVEEQPDQHPARVYLAFYGAPNDNTPAVLDALQSAGVKATFFLPVSDPAAWRDDLVRRLVAEGHTPALLLDADAQAAPDTLTASLAAANARLAFVAGASARIVSNDGGCAALTEAQRDTLVQAGYRLWDAALDSGDQTQSAARAYATTAQQFASTSGTLVVRLHHSGATAGTVQSLTGYMSRQHIPSAAISLSDRPINGASDAR